MKVSVEITNDELRSILDKVGEDRSDEWANRLQLAQMLMNSPLLEGLWDFLRDRETDKDDDQ